MNQDVKEVLGCIVAATAFFFSTPTIATFVDLPASAQIATGTVTYHDYLTKYRYKKNTTYFEKSAEASIRLFFTPFELLSASIIINTALKKPDECIIQKSEFTHVKKDNIAQLLCESVGRYSEEFQTCIYGPV